MNDFSVLPNQVETCVQQLIAQKFQEDNLYSIFPEPPLKRRRSLTFLTDTVPSCTIRWKMKKTMGFV